MEILSTCKWFPRIGPSNEAIERMRSHSVQPSEPMGEAWFNTLERRMYTELFVPGAVKEMDQIDLSFLLFEIASGTSCFGHLPEWDEWFRYLLPDLIERSGEALFFETHLIESVVTAFLQIYWKGIDEHYDGFRADVMASLPLTITGKGFWSETPEGPKPDFLDLQTDGRGELKLFWNSYEADPTVSAAIFFCIKYLRAAEIPSWAASVTAIEHELWQGNLMVWFVGALETLTGNELGPALENKWPTIEWDHSHVLGSRISPEEFEGGLYNDFNDRRNFLSKENAGAFLDVMKTYYTPEKILHLADRFSTEEHIAISTHRIPEMLMAKLYP